MIIIVSIFAPITLEYKLKHLGVVKKFIKFVGRTSMVRWSLGENINY